MNNAFISLTGTLYNLIFDCGLMKNFFLLLSISILTACGGFYKPHTLRMEVPNGPPEFQAGWHDGCSSALNTMGFQNARFMPLTLGSGIYQHDPIYQMAYGKAVFSCATMTGDFMGHPMFTAPLEN